jgi:hypothetical protein
LPSDIKVALSRCSGRSSCSSSRLDVAASAVEEAVVLSVVVVTAEVVVVVLVLVGSDIIVASRVDIVVPS